QRPATPPRGPFRKHRSPPARVHTAVLRQRLPAVHTRRADRPVCLPPVLRQVACPLPGGGDLGALAIVSRSRPLPAPDPPGAALPVAGRANESVARTAQAGTAAPRRRDARGPTIPARPAE